jgi:hypothetical protein
MTGKNTWVHFKGYSNARTESHTAGKADRSLERNRILHSARAALRTVSRPRGPRNRSREAEIEYGHTGRSFGRGDKKFTAAVVGVGVVDLFLLSLASVIVLLL